jgi:hypothetical protein
MAILPYDRDHKWKSWIESTLSNYKISSLITYFDNVFEEGTDVESFGSTLHENTHAVLEDGNGGKKAQNSEYESADGVCDLPGWLEVNNDSSYHYSYTLNAVSNYVDHSSPHVHVSVIVACMAST